MSPTASLPSTSQDILETARHLLYNKALVYFQGKPIGTIAALPQKVRNYSNGQVSVSIPGEDLNYTEVFIRDNVPSMLYFLVDDRPEIVRNFLDICLSLQSQQPQTAGIFPTSFHVSATKLTADYGQRAIGRVVSVDATLWWLILAQVYSQWTQDWGWAAQETVQQGLKRFLRLILHPGFREAPTLHVPDGAFMIDRPLDVWGAPLEIQVLLYGALLSTTHLILQGRGRELQEDERQQVEQSLDLAIRLRRYLLKHYWLNSRIVQILRRRPTDLYGDRIVNEYNIRTETIPHWLQTWLGDRGGYLIGNVRTGRLDFRFFTLGNCLAAIFDLLPRPQQKALFHLISQNRHELFAEMPLRICHPPLDHEDWRNKTGYDPKNKVWCYHNAGHWPCLFWFLVIAILRQESPTDELVADSYAYHRLLKDGYETLLSRLPEQQWAEYFDGPTGVWIGQQARAYQTWTITSLLLSEHFLIRKSADKQIMNLPSLGSLIRQKQALQAG
ncbi:glycoside hydrolase 100 family protein [Synechococcus sp. PCC 6312]|uniref:glycoside hydrolase 100 family protein n=1 Tax=Synechococcus sp. (strain ATCC 27167 / PCC 6312) TaxID=195253 RepID=UPI00029F3281|nr:glycoside hydrolase 100 family protein [Synechococcus sp. PCC 6312]AFY61783.1 glycogen debranching enzyme [Synechococcus sp. PCC 6312]